MPHDEPVLDGLGAANLPRDGARRGAQACLRGAALPGHPAARAGCASPACISPINHVIKNSSKKILMKKSARTLGLISHQQGSITHPSAPRTTSAATLVSAAGCSPHPFPGSSAPFLSPAVNPPPCNEPWLLGLCAGASHPPGSYGKQSRELQSGTWKHQRGHLPRTASPLGLWSSPRAEKRDTNMEKKKKCFEMGKTMVTC